MPKSGKEQRERLPWGCRPEGAGIPGTSQLASSDPLSNQGKVAGMWEHDWTLPMVPERHLNNAGKSSHLCASVGLCQSHSKCALRDRVWTAARAALPFYRE